MRCRSSEKLRDFEEPACRDAIGTVLEFLNLLEGKSPSRFASSPWKQIAARCLFSRSKSGQTSYLGKFAAHGEIIREHVHKAHWSVPNLLVLTPPLISGLRQ
jgi:hypothetical protein